MAKTLYVTCTVSKGLFDSEFYITLQKLLTPEPRNWSPA